MAKFVVICSVVVIILVAECSAQPNYFNGMGFLQNMMNDIADMNARMSGYGYRMFEEGMRRSQSGRRYGPGGTSFRTRDGQGYAYNSPDGSYSSFSYSYGSPNSHGYEYHYGPDGRTYSRTW